MKTTPSFFLKKLLLSGLIKRQKDHTTDSETGFVLLIAITIVIALSALAALYAKTSRIEQQSTTSTIDSNSGFYAAEAGLNIRANKIREAYLDYEQPKGKSPSSPTACFDSDNSNDGTLDFKCDKFELAPGDPNRSNTQATTYVVAKNNGIGTSGVVPDGDTFQGLSMLEYGHSIYSMAFKDNISASKKGKQAVAILQMDVVSRLIPMFQFAAFYTKDLEIFPGADMILTGPVHTNGNLYLGANTSLKLNSQVTTVKDIFNFKPANGDTFADGKVQIANASGNFLKLLSKGTGSTSPTTNFMDPTRIKTAWGTQVQVRTDAPISIPEPSILNDKGDYYTKADIRIKFKPESTSTGGNMNYLKKVPFEVTAIKRTNADGSPVDPPVPVTLNSNQLDSLRQPVMAKADLANIASANFKVCTPATLSGSLQTWWNGLTSAKKNNFREVAQEYIQEQIQSQKAPLRFSFMALPIKDVKGQAPNLYGSFAQNTSSLKSANKLGQTFANGSDVNTAVSNLDDMSAQQIAGLLEYDGSNSAISNTARCFVPAPITEVGRDDDNHLSPFRFFNTRENQDLRLLQMNLSSFAIWNRDGVSLNGGNTLDSTAGLLYTPAPVDNNAPADSFQRLGLAAVDNSQAGMVLHGTIDGNIFTKAKTNKSPYGFAVIGGKQLFGLAKTTTYPDPTGLTIASDQAIYVQGDYNTVNKQPAALLADSFNPLSNACLNQDSAINHEKEMGCRIDGSTKLATDTGFNAAVLAGVDVSKGSDYNGGLENYPRFSENWSGKTWLYRGSFVSISTPLYVSGKWPGTGGIYYKPPKRDWDYDSDFNIAKNLPPLTPQFVSLKQNSFIRNFDQ